MLQKKSNDLNGVSGRGGFRPGSGRPKGKQTVVVRVDADLLPIIELLKNAPPDRLENALLALKGLDGFTSLCDFLRPYRD